MKTQWSKQPATGTRCKIWHRDWSVKIVWFHWLIIGSACYDWRLCWPLLEKLAYRPLIGAVLWLTCTLANNRLSSVTGKPVVRLTSTWPMIITWNSSPITGAVYNDGHVDRPVFIVFAVGHTQCRDDWMNGWNSGFQNPRAFFQKIYILCLKNSRFGSQNLITISCELQDRWF